MEKKKKPELSAAEAASLNESWDEAAKSIRQGLLEGNISKSDACAIGLTLDSTHDDAKTDYINIGMMNLAIELVEFLMTDGGPTEKASRERTIAYYKAEIARVQGRMAETAEDTAKALEAEAAAKAKREAEYLHLHSEAAGIFATCTVASILGTPMAQGLPNF